MFLIVKTRKLFLGILLFLVSNFRIQAQMNVTTIKNDSVKIACNTIRALVLM